MTLTAPSAVTWERPSWAVADHPAKFSPPILEQLGALLTEEALSIKHRPCHVLDPCGGIGTLHQLEGLTDNLRLTSLELEAPWAGNHPRNVCGDATRAPFARATFRAVATSIVYPNRLTDSHNARDRCKPCAGTGCTVEGCRGFLRADADHKHARCKVCRGAGGLSRRNTYTHRMRAATGDPAYTMNTASTAVLGWADPWRQAHERMFREFLRMVEEDGLILLNVSNHLETVGTGRRKHKREAHVVEWVTNAFLVAGCRIAGAYPIATKRMTQGANRERVPFEYVLAFRTPEQRTLLSGAGQP
jgi:hypothetical protein